jgi:hypothetical protein
MSIETIIRQWKALSATAPKAIIFQNKALSAMSL